MLDGEITDIIDRTSRHVEESYVFASAGAELAGLLRHRHAAGAYLGAGDLAELAELAELVTTDHRSVNDDRHLGLRHHHDGVPDLPSNDLIEAQLRAEAVRTLGGVAWVELLTGNVALVELAPTLYNPSVAGDAVAAAMTLASRADAMVLDLRGNHGGDPRMVAFVCSYLFGDEPVHLTDMYERESDRTIPSWTLPYVPGGRFGPDRPVRLLTSATTFSGAEELAYDLQQLGRAQVVGERTGGGANPGMGYRVHPYLRLMVPTGRSVNPVSGTNWEDTGVVPDVEAPAAQALDAALATLR